MDDCKSSQARPVSSNLEARQIHEMAYLKHRTGANETEIRKAM